MDPNQKPKTTAADFFLHLGVVAVLYTFVGFLINLLFTVIDVAYPPVAENYFVSPSISFPVAALIVLFPVFVLLSYLTLKTYAVDQTKKQLGVRKWLAFLTLFVTGVIVAGDLITIIYYFLDGRDMTVSFLLKALSLLVIATIIFVYYAQDLREKVSSSQRKIWMLMALILTIGAIASGFSVIGSPKSQRLIRYDQQKAGDLQNIQWQIINFWQAKQKLPQNLEELKDPISGQVIPTDTQFGKSYEYTAIGVLSFKLCANFNKESVKNAVGNYPSALTQPVQYMMVPQKGVSGMNDSWQHKMGYTCFDRTIDPEIYPPNRNTSVFTPKY